MINYIKGLLKELFVPAASIVVEEIEEVVVIVPAKQRAGTVAEVKLAPVVIAPVKKARKPNHSKKKATTKPSK
jgi:hypothetical protein